MVHFINTTTPVQNDFSKINLHDGYDSLCCEPGSQE